MSACRVLLLGCGSNWRRKLPTKGHPVENDWEDQVLVTVDNNPYHHPTILLDLNEPTWALPEDSYDEVHAYEVLEHLGRQGDVRSFFATFSEIYRVLKPGGILAATVPWHRSEWAWGDPSHTRVITPGTLVFLSQSEYAKQVGKTAMSDFRSIWRGDFETVQVQPVASEGGTVPVQMYFWLKAIKPARF